MTNNIAKEDPVTVERTAVVEFLRTQARMLALRGKVPIADEVTNLALLIHQGQHVEMPERRIRRPWCAPQDPKEVFEKEQYQI